MSIGRSMALATVLGLSLISLSATAAAREMPLRVLLESLRQQEYDILYSSALVHQEMRVTVESVSLQALQQALPELGLRLEQRGGVWVIISAPTPPLEQPAAGADPEQAEPPENVIVTGSMHRFPTGDLVGSSQRFTPEAMNVVPVLASDAMRVALRLPGVSSVGVSAKPRIRGGLQDELLVIQDGVELLEPFHLADYHSAYSSIDYHTIESVDIYTGGFPSRYGNRMSGVIDISNDWEKDEYQRDIGISSFANFINVRGQFGESQPGNWLLSVRQGDLSDLTDYIQTRSGDPKYKDAAARMNVALSEASTLALGAVYSEDDIEFQDEEETASSQIETWYLWANLDSLHGRSVRSKLSLSYTDFQRRKMQGSFELEAKGGILDHRQDVERLSLRHDISRLFGQRLLEFGWQAEYSRGDYRHTSRIDRGELADILGTERIVERDISQRPEGGSGGAYLAAEWELASGLLIQPSLRWDFQDYYLQRGTEQQLSPRLGLAYELGESTRLRLSLGRFNQPEGIQELQVIDGIERFFKPQQSDQVIAGLEWDRGDLEFVAEIYYKRYRDQKGRFENMFNPFVLLPEMEPDRVGLYPQRASAQGLDLDLKVTFLPALTGQLRYSHMQAQDRIEGKWIERRWSQQHTLNASLIWQKQSYSLSAAITWHSGWRSTQLPPVVPEGVVIPVSEVLNNTLLRDYFSLDISARKSWRIGKTQLQVYADISNVTDRANVAGIDWDVDEGEDENGNIFFLLSPDSETLLKRVPSMGITLSF
ncbi:MAG: TonB-dependent receptor [Gammaproteobacteria bacterium]|nr:TonB-dependent receptor [Gammaproteobacteria bacterium]